MLKIIRKWNTPIVLRYHTVCLAVSNFSLEVNDFQRNGNPGLFDGGQHRDPKRGFLEHLPCFEVLSLNFA